MPQWSPKSSEALVLSDESAHLELPLVRHMIYGSVCEQKARVTSAAEERRFVVQLEMGSFGGLDGSWRGGVIRPGFKEMDDEWK
ncbi:hypothetical protein KUCAC02_031534 [Chaenocephalus aceratus]|nr:hypothetical protein KUCAC02_031534 [Chaenocephalus aceratus]